MGNKYLLWIGVAVIGFLAYRYIVHGKGNKSLINPTMFGF